MPKLYQEFGKFPKIQRLFLPDMRKLKTFASKITRLYLNKNFSFETYCIINNIVLVIKKKLLRTSMFVNQIKINITSKIVLNFKSEKVATNYNIKNN